MKNINIINLEKYDAKENYEFVEEGIHKDLNDKDDTNYRTVLSYENEKGEGQYPLEDILDKYYIYVSDFITDFHAMHENKVIIELAGSLKGIRSACNLVGKRVYNEEYIGEDGEEYIKLVIE